MTYDPAPRTRAELDELFGSDDRVTPRRVINLTERIEKKAAEDMPEASELADAQIVNAVERLHENTTSYPQFPWPSLARLTGPMCPEDLLFAMARTGHGKTLFLLNVFDALVSSGHVGLYVGLEQSPMILRSKWACMRVDVAPKLVLATRADERGSPDWVAAMSKVQDDLKWQRTPEIKARAHFSAERTINAAGLKRWTEWAVERGAAFVIVDHIDRVQLAGRRNPFDEISETVRLAKELAVKHRITMLLASQVSRPGDPLEQFIPPALSSMRGAGTKEEEADTVLGIYRPLRATVTDKELKLVRQGLRDKDTVIEPNVMGVMMLKHRLDGRVAGKTVKLEVRHQRIVDLAERDRWTTDGHRPMQLL